MAKNKRSTFGSVIRIKDREGWYLIFKRDGKRIIKKGGETKRAAEDKRARIQALVLDGAALSDAVAQVFGGKPAPTTRGGTSLADVGDLQSADRAREPGHKARTLYKREQLIENHKRQTPWFSIPVQDVTHHELREWKNEQTRAGAADATVQNSLSLGSSIFKFGQETGAIDETLDNPFSRVRLKSVRKKQRAGLDTEEMRDVWLPRAKHVLGSKDAPAFDLILAGASTSWRLGELATLCWGEVDLAYPLKGRTVARLECLPHQDKMRRGKVAFACGALLEHLRAIKEAAGPVLPSALVFTQHNGSGWTDPTMIGRRVRKVCDSIGPAEIPAWKMHGNAVHTRFCFHCLRHSANTILLSAGVAPHVVAAILGHQSGSMTTGNYYTPPEADLLAGCETLAVAIDAKAHQGRTDAPRASNA